MRHLTVLRKLANQNLQQYLSSVTVWFVRSVYWQNTGIKTNYIY